MSEPVYRLRECASAWGAGQVSHAGTGYRRTGDAEAVQLRRIVIVENIQLAGIQLHIHAADVINQLANS